MKHASNKPDGIRLIGLYPMNKSKYLYAYVYDGHVSPDGRRNLVRFCTWETDFSKARAKAQELLLNLKNKKA